MKEKILNEFCKNSDLPIYSDLPIFQAYEKAIDDLGLENSHLIIFPEGVDDLFDFFIDKIDQEMKFLFLDRKEKSISKNIETILSIRIDLLSKNKNLVRKIVSYYNLLNSKSYSRLYNTIDNIWYLIGDKSTDFNFYSKRLILAKIYVKMIAYFLQDESLDNIDTKEFIKREIQNTLKISKLKAKIKDLLIDKI